MVLGFLAGLSAAAPPSAHAGDADVIAAQATRQPDGSYEVSATIRHADEGWHHYADRFDVMTPDGQVIGKRVLAHPHVEEQPFTRSLGGVAIPEGVDGIRVRAHDTVHGLGGQEVSVKLTR
ncbi:MAG: hypothetical protein APF80_10205 [Alphaproteobacteria bacterium BRH_c36]|nr:MAG: hypothetical protein APF80_10205 [Alphaproteobacteria bacterium BRH_c36]